MVRDAPGGLERKIGTASLSRRTPHRHAGTNAGAARGDPLSSLAKRPGDTLSVMNEIIEITPSRSRAQRNV